MSVEPKRLTKREGLEVFLARNLKDGDVCLQALIEKVNYFLEAQYANAPAYTREFECPLTLHPNQFKREADLLYSQKHPGRTWSEDFTRALTEWLGECYAVPGEPDVLFAVQSLTYESVTLRVSVDYFASKRLADRTEDNGVN